MADLLSNNQLEVVKDFISVELLKRGYTAPIISIGEVEGRNESRIEFRTENFQTTPVLFKELFISNFSSAVRRDEKLSKEHESEIYRIWIQVSVRYKNFDGGSNGANLFTIRGTFRKGEDSIYDLITD